MSLEATPKKKVKYLPLCWIKKNANASSAVNQDILLESVDQEVEAVAVDMVAVEMVAVALTVNVTTLVSKVIKRLTARNSKKIKIKGLTDIRLIQKLVQQQLTEIMIV